MPKVSVIVPVYNAEKYLQECVDSILRQTLADLELILVDDGSTDSSPALCDRYAEQDARVKVIHKPNGRAASARNAGIRAASGDYVAFVDSDDWVSPEMYEKMLGTGADVTLCDYVRFQGKTETPFTQPNVNAGFYDKAQMREKIYPHLVMDGIEYPITIQTVSCSSNEMFSFRISSPIVRIFISARTLPSAPRCCIARTLSPT